MHYVKRVAALLLPFAVTACAMTPPPPIREDYRIPVLAIDSSSSSPSSSSSNHESPTTEPITLASAIHIALLNTPELRADFARFEAMLLEVPQVSSLPDPRVSYAQFVEGVQTRTGEQQFIAGVSQTIPWFGKLALRGRMAETQAMQVLHDYRAKMLDIQQQVSSAWYRLQYEEAALALKQEDKATIEQSLDAAAALYASGQKGRAALLKAQTEMARVENEILGFEPRIETLRAELNRLLGDSRGRLSYNFDFQTSVSEPANNLPLSLPLPLPLSLLMTEAANYRPELERYRLMQAEATIEHELARKDYYPDFTLGVNYIGIGDRPDNPVGMAAPDDEGEDAWNLSVGFNIPIPNARRAAARHQALKKREEAILRRDAEGDKISESIHSILPRLQALDAQLKILRDSLLPLAEEAYATSRASYESGGATFLDLLDAQRTYIAVRGDLLRVRRDYLLAITDLERAIGARLPKESKDIEQ